MTSPAQEPAAATASSSLEAVVDVPEPQRAKRRGPGRNLPAAIAVGGVLVVVLLVSVLVVPQAFPVVAAIAMVGAVLELTRASSGGLEVPPVPLLVGVIGMVVSTVVFGRRLLLSTAAAVSVLILWRVTESMA